MLERVLARPFIVSEVRYALTRVASQDTGTSTGLMSSNAIEHMWHHNLQVAVRCRDLAGAVGYV